MDRAAVAAASVIAAISDALRATSRLLETVFVFKSLNPSAFAPRRFLLSLPRAFEMVTTRSKTKSASLIGVMPGTLYVKIWAFMMVGYAAQMLLIPANMVTDHWDIPSTPGMEFWIRGASVGFGCTAYLLTKVDTET